MVLWPANKARRPFVAPAARCTKAPMSDIVFLAVIVGFFALAALAVAACDRIVGPDPTDLDQTRRSDR